MALARARLSAVAAATLFLLVSCLPVALPTPPPSSAGPAGGRLGAAPEGADMTPALLAKPIPTADVFDLVRRVKGRSGTPAAAFEPVRSTPRDEHVGSRQDFWVYDFASKRNVRVSATLRAETDSAKWWVEDDVSEDAALLARTAQTFQDKIYPTDRRLFGPQWSPGIDDDPRIDVLIARIPGAAAGYFSSADELPRWVDMYSAERQMIYVNAISAQLDSNALYSVLAHEFCHMIQFGRRSRSAIWFNEGQAQLCEHANGYGSGFEEVFLQRPDTQLDAWTELDRGAAAHYGASYLFLEYLRGRTGGSYSFINALMSQGVETLADVDRALRAEGRPGIDRIIGDFVAANALVGSSPDPRYAYPADVHLRSAARPAPADQVAVGGDLRSSVYPQAARYVELPGAAAYRVHFAAPATTRIIPTSAHSGTRFWWSDRADGMDSTLTRTVDLTSVTRASLTFWTWYELEKDFDYAYVAVSTDAGKRWTTLATGATTTSDPNGNNLGNAFTGTSGGGSNAVWTEQHADLTPYAGKRILLRFENVTDPALDLPGFAVDDIAIPQIGYRDDAEATNGWDAKGFILSTNTIRESYIVQLIRRGTPPTVERHVVTGGALDLRVDATHDGAPPILAVTPLALRTTEPQPFEVTVTAAP